MIEVAIERVHARIKELEDQLTDPTLDREMYEFSEEFIQHLIDVNKSVLSALVSKGH